MKSPDRQQLEKYLNGVVAQIEGWIGGARRVGEEDVTDIVLVVKTPGDTIKAFSHYTTAERDE
jgi:hypothetical protein